MKTDFLAPPSRFAFGLAVVVCCIAGRADAQLEQEPIQAEILFTEGPFGELHDDTYFLGEDPYIAIRINGLAAGEGDDGLGHVAGVLKWFDPAGKLAFEMTVPATKFREVLGPAPVLLLLSTNQSGRREPDKPCEVRWEGIHVESQRKFTATRRFVWKEPKRLSIIEYRFLTFPDCKTEVGRILEAGRDYVVRMGIAQSMVMDGKANFRVRLTAHDRQGRQVSPATIERKGSFIADPTQDGALILQVDLPLQFNRPGEFLVRATVEDLNNGATTVRDFPVTAVSPFDVPLAAQSAESPGDKLNVQLKLTQGRFGGTRRDDLYFENEEIYAVAKIEGLTVDENAQGRMGARLELVDAGGNLLFERKIEPIEFQQFVAGDSRLLPITAATNYPSGKPARLHLKVTITDLNAGTTSSASCELVANADQRLRATGHYISLDQQGAIPAGSVLHVGEVYYLQGAVVGLAIGNGKIDFDLTLKGTTSAGEALSKFQLESHHALALSRFSEPVRTARFHQVFSVNRAGEYALEIAVKDNQNGGESIELIPIRTVAQP